jgi:hypothetical protein
MGAGAVDSVSVVTDIGFVGDIAQQVVVHGLLLITAIGNGEAVKAIVVEGLL